MGDAMKLPVKYGRNPILRPTGSLAETFRVTIDSIEENFNLLQATTTQINAYLKDIDGRIPEDVTARVYALERGRMAVYASDPGDPAVGAGMAYIVGGSGTWDFVVKVNEAGTVYSVVTPLVP